MTARPNVLLVFTDQQRLDTIQEVFSNFKAETPTMDFLAQEGVVFDNCHCTAPICGPSRSTLMTGLYPSQAGMPGNLFAPCPPLNPTIPTIGNFFRNAGYETMYHGKWHLGGQVTDYGFEQGVETTHDETARQLASQCWRNRDWLENERPFLHVVSFINPHDHYFYDPSDAVEGRKRPFEATGYDTSKALDFVTDKMADFSEEQWGAYLEFYEEQLERVDKELAELLHQFKTGGYYNNSWIIFTSDHGDMAGEHDLPFKGPYMYDGVLKVPLIIVPPITRFLGCDRKKRFEHDIKPFKTSAHCSLADIVPTMLDIAGIEAPEHLPGKSLLPIVKGETTADAHEAVYAEWHNPPIRAVRTRKWKYVKYLNIGEQLFDLENDPNEMCDLANDAEFSDAKAEMSALLEQHIAERNDPFYDLDKHEFIHDPSPYQVRGTG